MAAKIKRSTIEKFQRIVTIYRGKFTELRIEKKEFPHDKHLLSANAGLAHCYDLLDKIDLLLKKEDIEKARHWIGFVQSALFMEGMYTIDQLKNHGE